MRLLLLVVGISLIAVSHADVTLPAGTCQNYSLFNESGNSTYNQTICAENAPITYNITNNTGDIGNFTQWANSSAMYNNGTLNVTCRGNLTVQNITVQNVTNVTYSSCNAMNMTMWANSTQTVNNATVSCLANATAPTQISLDMWANSSQSGTWGNATCRGNLNVVQNTTMINCNYSAEITPSDAIQRVQNSSIGLDILIEPIPTSYCHENRNEEASEYRVFYSAKSNNTFTCKLPQAIACPATNSTCPATPACVAQREVIYSFNVSDGAQNVSCSNPIRMNICPDDVKTIEESNALLKGNLTLFVAERTKQIEGTRVMQEVELNGTKKNLETTQTSLTAAVNGTKVWGDMGQIVGMALMVVAGGYYFMRSRSPRTSAISRDPDSPAIAKFDAALNNGGKP